MLAFLPQTLLVLGLAVQSALSSGPCPAGLTCSGNSQEESFLVNKINSNACFVISKSYCPYCRRAKETLANEGAKCDIVELDLRDDGMALQGTIAKMTGRRTVPQVFLHGKFIGGSDDTVNLSMQGKLSSLIKSSAKEL